MVIYLFTNKINNKQYVGLTTRTLEARTQEHLRSNHTVIGKALDKYGFENFDLEVIDSAETIDELNDLEIHYIDKLNTMTPNGYNLCIGGGTTTGYTHSEEARRRMSETKKNKGSMVGEKNHFYGKSHTDETKKAISEIHKGRKLTKEHREKLSKNSAYAKPVKCVDDGNEFASAKEAGDHYGINPSHIGRVCRGVNKTTHGKVFEFIN